MALHSHCAFGGEKMGRHSKNHKMTCEILPTYIFNVCLHNNIQIIIQFFFSLLIIYGMKMKEKQKMGKSSTLFTFFQRKYKIDSMLIESENKIGKKQK